MKLSGSKKITATFAALASALAITSLVAKTRQEHHGCTCGGAGCECDDYDIFTGTSTSTSTGTSTDTSTELHVPEPSVQKVSRVRKLGTRKADADLATSMHTVEALQEMFSDIKGKTLPNESIAKIIMGLINLQNTVRPEDAIDIRNIHFMKYGKQNHMVIDLYTADFGAPKHEEELNRLWHDVFLAEDFWNADFVKVRVNVKNKKRGGALEMISCGLEDVRRYLLKQNTLQEFQASWTRKKPKTSNKESYKSSGKSSGDEKLGKLKRA